MKHPTDSPQPGSADRQIGATVHSLHIATLFALAVVQPLLDLIGRHPEFLVAQGLGTGSVLLFVAGLAFVVPLVTWGILFILRGLHARLEAAVARLAVGALAGLLTLQIFNRTIAAPGPLLLTEAVGVGLGVCWLYRHVAPVRLFLTVLSPSIFIFPLLFLFSSGLMRGDGRPAAGVSVEARTPVVMVVFDELPVLSLLDETGGIDPVRYPNLAALAQQAHWFENATTVSEGTLISVPAILDGLYPTPGQNRLPTRTGHPRSLFTLLGRSHHLNIQENITQLAPADAVVREPNFWRLLSDLKVLYLHLVTPLDLASSLPPVTQTWTGFAGPSGPEPEPGHWSDFDADWAKRRERFREFIDSIQPTPRPGLHFFHCMLPHASWKYLPDGRVYTLYEKPGVAGVVGPNSQGVDANQWQEDEWPVIQGYQRHLLQVAFVDHLVGDLVSHLKEQNLYDQSLLILTADHGAAFLPGDSRRIITPTNYPGILAVPLFIKEPFQTEGHRSQRNVETIDILPTIIDVLEADASWPLDGVSVLSGQDDRSEKTAFSDKGERFTFDTRLAKKEEFLQRQVELFGSRGWGRLFQAGPHPELVGRKLSDFSIRRPRSSDPTVTVEGKNFFENVDLKSNFLLCLVRGRLEQPGDAGPTVLAVAVNGVIRATTRTSPVLENHRIFTALVDPAAFRAGPNQVEVVLVDTSGGEPVLRFPRTAEAPTALETAGDGKEFLVLDTGKRVPLREGVIQGWVVGGETETSDGYYVGGWVVDQKARTLVSSVVVVVGGQVVASGPSRFERPEAVRLYDDPGLARCGFRLEFQWPPEAELGTAEVRVLALSPQGAAGDLHRPQTREHWPFLTAPKTVQARASTCTVGETLRFGEEGNVSPCLREGWTAPSPGVTWSSGQKATLAIQTEPPSSGALLLEAFFKPFLAPGQLDRQRIRILLNGQTVGTWEASQNAFQTYRLQIPHQSLPASGPLLLEFQTPDAASPAALGTGPDQRILGLAMIWIRLTSPSRDGD